MVLSLIRLMRPGDWTKNLFVLPALIVSAPRLIEEGAGAGPLAFHTVLAFVAFCLLASGFYAVNDAIDAAKDRQHPVKRRRPVASGAVPISAIWPYSAIPILVGRGISRRDSSGLLN